MIDGILIFLFHESEIQKFNLFDKITIVMESKQLTFIYVADIIYNNSGFYPNK
jgi:hypothetical protein